MLWVCGMVAHAHAQTLSATSLKLRVGLVLPTQSADFAKAAQAVQAGVRAGFIGMGQDAEITLIETDGTPERELAALKQAQTSGLQVVIGPLTRSAVTAAARQGAQPLPTLALNVLDDLTPLPKNLFTFSLAIESEAKQLAQLAYTKTEKTKPSPARGASKPSVVIVIGSGALNRRAAQAFADTFRQLGGEVRLEVDAFSNNLKDLLESSDAPALFLATDAGVAQRIRPYAQAFVIFGTSQLNESRNTGRGRDLDEIFFTDMPWNLKPDHAAVMVFPRNNPSNGARYNNELERLYALGIDAYRLATELARGTQSFNLDGVTGQLNLRGNRIERESLIAVFRNGQAVLENN